MEQSDFAELRRLLEKLNASGLGLRDVPHDVWLLLHGLVPQPAVEIAVVRNDREILLNHRQDEHWHGWEMPGGYVHYRESLADACNRIAQREIGTGVILERIVTAYMWPDHPYGSPLSVVCRCRADGTPSSGQFFAQLPDDMVLHHAEFARAALGLVPLEPT
jgi:ADP-ribose pyrophosphatase YjhB (NUDIX family)